MTDFEITRLCAEAMDYQLGEMIAPVRGAPKQQMVFMNGRAYHEPYDPLHDDAQAMALVKKFHLLLFRPFDKWQAVPAKWWNKAPQFIHDGDYNPLAQNDDLNRAICECVAKMQAAKAAPHD